MAQPNKPKPAPRAEPRTTEELEALEAERAAITAAEPPEHVDAASSQLPPGPDVGELEERAAEAENRAEAAEREVLSMRQEMDELRRQFAQLAAMARSPQGRPDAATIEQAADGQPVFDESLPYGVVTGEGEVGYVQEGHQFDRAKRYLATEPHGGVGHRFNPRLVGFVRPRPGAALADPLDGFRDR